MKPNFLNLFMKKLTRDLVVPIISARISWLTSVFCPESERVPQRISLKKAKLGRVLPRRGRRHTVQCGRFPYFVGGSVLENNTLVVMHGLAPRVDRACRVRGKLRDTLKFRYISTNRS
jgi:hypothetical protein